jgi:hypothetical protein
MALKRALGLATFLSLFILLVEAAIPVSFSSYPSYLEQQKCVKVCLWEVGTLDDLIAKIGCSPPWVNECLCNPDLARRAANFVSDCVASRCTTPRTAPAVTSALSAYNGYCSDNGFSIPTLASINSDSAYVSQPSCVQKCLWNLAESPDDHLMPAIGCHAPWENACLCNATLASTASAFLSTCVASRCVTAVDAPPVTAALGVHEAYCSSAGLPLPAVVTTSTESSTESKSHVSTTSATSGSQSSEPTAVAGVTQQQNSGTPPTVGDQARPIILTRTGPSTGVIAGIAVGSIVAVSTLVAVAAFIMFKRRANRSETLPWTTAKEVEHPPYWIHEKPTDMVAVEVGCNHPPTLFELHP